MEDSSIKNPELSTFEQLYANAKFEEAFNYLEENSQLYSKGEYYYNLGTVRLKMNDFAKARYDFELAKHHGYQNSALSNNLTYSEKMLGLDDLTHSTVVSEKLINTLTNIPSNGYVTMTLGLLLITLLAIRFGSVIKKSTMIILIIISFIPLFVGKLYVGNLTTGIVLEDSAIYEGPSKVFTEKGNIKAGSKIIIGETKETWLFIEYPVSLTGWIEKDKLGLY